MRQALQIRRQVPLHHWSVRMYLIFLHFIVFSRRAQ